ncbi:MAG TPA: sigma-70 family RNA polymerase sigma factor [Acidimicrobiales bacterium]|nr:sigma-70 family RNA polymerase sigma factor [Acidimicrobiales bacterium]
MAAAQTGDRTALDTLLRRHADRWHALCRRVMGDDADAADALQEAMIAVVRGIDRFDGRSQFSTWSYRVATNACLDELRRRKRRPEPVEDDALDVGARFGGNEATDAVGERVDIDAALATLAPEFRAAVVLRDLVGLDYAEIGEVLGAPAGTVKSRIARGRAALADLLGNPPVSPDRPTTRS